MDSSVGKLVFCSISKKERILYSYNGGDSSVDSLARLCLSRAPPFHRHYFHTSAGRTFAFLWEGDLTYFLITIITTTTTTTDANSTTPTKHRILSLLHQIHHGFSSGSAEIVAIVRRLIESTGESMSRLDRINGLSSSTTTTTSSTEAPLLPDRREEEEEVSLEVEADPVALRLQQQLQKERLAAGLWWRHAKIVIVADAAICGVLFGVWMAVCRGFQCVS